MSLLAVPDIENNWRYEIKNRLTYQLYQQVKNALQPFIQLDPYTEAVP